MSHLQTMTSITEYSATAAGLAEIRQRLANVVFDVKTPAGLEEARKARRELVGLRVKLEEIRQREKAPVLERGRLLDTEARRIESEIRAIEDPIDQQIKAEEARKQAEKDERERLERNRVLEIRGRIDQMARLPLLLTGAAAAKLRDVRAKLVDQVIDAESLAEFLDEALQVRADVVKQLDAAIERQEAHEAEQARLKAEREEIDRQKAEQARIDAEQRAAREEEDRQRRARLDQDEREAREKREREERDAKAKREREEAEAKAAREKADREAREARERADCEAAEARAAERKRLDDEAAALAKQQREQREREEQAERDRRAAEEKAVETSLALFESNPVMQEIIRLALDVRIAPHGPACRAALMRLCEAVSTAIDKRARQKREKAAA